MPRKRYLKPGFFKNEDLASLNPLTRILFQGLWCWADREGRLEDRPMRLKAEIMPYDNIDIDATLNDLQTAGFIIRYTTKANDKDFKAIQIVTFKEHQDVNVKEQQSTIPAPCLHGVNTTNELNENSESTPLNLELSTLNTELSLEVDVDKAQARKNEIEDAIVEFTTRDKNSNASFPEQAHLPEKEKSSAKKEKVLPTVDEAMSTITDTAYWRNVVEHHKCTEAERIELFQIFYEQKEDHYKIRYPTRLDMAQNYYNWIPIHKLKPSLQKLIPQNNDHTGHKTTGQFNGHRKRTEETKRDVANLVNQSAEFLRLTAGS